MSSLINGQVRPTNSGLVFDSTERLVRKRRSYERLLRQMEAHGAADVAVWNVEGYLAELDAALAARATAPEAAR